MFSDIILASLEDTSPNQIVTRVAKRIVAKGFELNHIAQEPGYREGFHWGRSSHGTTTRVIWQINFSRPSEAEEHIVNVVVATTNYVKRNPYDRMPKDNNKPSFSIMATDPTKNILEWKTQPETT